MLRYNQNKKKEQAFSSSYKIILSNVLSDACDSPLMPMSNFRNVLEAVQVARRCLVSSAIFASRLSSIPFT